MLSLPLDITKVTALLLILLTPTTTRALEVRQQRHQVVTSIRNFRAVVPNLLYRSAALDELTAADVGFLIEEQPFCAILDLRNADERDKTTPTDASRQYYDWLAGPTATTELIPVPILRDVDSFWDVTISHMPWTQRVQATARTVVQGGALDEAAARYLESQGLFGLYRSMLQSASSEFGKALDWCLQANGPVLFHCQKGKDRTGLLSMLIQHCLGDSVSDIVAAYAESERNLGERQEIKAGNSNNAYIDWNLFRGSPAAAMKDTLTWIDATYGSVDGYLDHIGFTEKKRSLLREKLTT